MSGCNNNIEAKCTSLHFHFTMIFFSITRWILGFLTVEGIYFTRLHFLCPKLIWIKPLAGCDINFTLILGQRNKVEEGACSWEECGFVDEWQREGHAGSTTVGISHTKKLTDVEGTSTAGNQDRTGAADDFVTILNVITSSKWPASPSDRSRS